MAQQPDPSNKTSSLLGIIDLGTNTFHLLIASYSGTDWEEVYRIRKFVELGEMGVETLGVAPLQRAMTALKEFSEILDAHTVTKVKAFGTAALRTASNGPDFVQKVAKELNIEVDLIDGQEEARLIFEGAMQAVPNHKGPSMIMDIGGGSVEFILVLNKSIIWSQSFPVGVAVMFQKFLRSDPISREEVRAIQAFLEQQLKPMIQKLSEYPCTILIGASGTFDVMENIMPGRVLSNHAIALQVSDFPPLYLKLLKSTLDQRKNWKGIPPHRAKLIMSAMVLIEFVLGKSPFEEIWVSHYAMKEGMIADFLKKS
ncbi:MAG: phosphatase [Saprospiraceae bacterium]|nr:phosphatase [Saprospiraceae bacterium]